MQLYSPLKQGDVLFELIFNSLIEINEEEGKTVNFLLLIQIHVKYVT